MANIKGWRMVREDSGGEVLPGATQFDHHGKEWKVLGVVRAPEGATPGRLLAEATDGAKDGVWPGVFGLKIVPAEAMPEGAEELLASLAEEFDGSVEETAKELSMEGIDHMVEEHGVTAEAAITMAVISALTQHTADALMMGIMAAREHGRRQGLREAREGSAS